MTIITFSPVDFLKAGANFEFSPSIFHQAQLKPRQLFFGDFEQV